MVLGMKLNAKQREIYYEKGNWTTTTVFEQFSKQVKNVSATQIAVKDSIQQVTYKQLEQRVNEVVSGLFYFGIRRGDLVSVQLPNWIESIVIYLACAKIGAIFNPIPIYTRFHDLLNLVLLCEPKMLIMPREFKGFDYVSLAEQIIEKVNIPYVVIVKNGEQMLPNSFIEYEQLQKIPHEGPITAQADDALVILFTSGTEAQPKGVIHTHNTVLFTERTLAKYLQLDERDIILMPSPISHATGFLHGVNLPLTIGATTVLIDQYKKDQLLNLLVEHRCTLTMGATPFLYDFISALQQKESICDISAFRYFLCGGAPIPRYFLQEENKYTFKILPVYGTSESSPHIVGHPEDSIEQRMAYDGRLLPEIEVKVVDHNRQRVSDGIVGEEASRGPNVFVGYFKQPALTEQYIDEEGWFYSGDLCYIQNDYVRIVGRKKEIIIRGGQNITPVEVEDLLTMHPKIEQVALVGVPDVRLGEKVHAVVVLKVGEDFTFKEMIAYLDEKRIAKYKYPEQLHIVEDMPRTESGKIKKFKLLKDIRGQFK